MRSRPIKPRGRWRPMQLEALEARRLLTVLTPAQITAAYGFNGISFNTPAGPVAGNGAGQTIAIVDAYNDTHISQDLSAFDAQYGLPDTNVLTVHLMGGPTEAYNTGWAMETSLDVEWAHAIAPGAQILLVEASSAGLGDLLNAVSYASANASVVSMSWGTSEFMRETSYDTYFTTPGVTYIASSGDTGATPMWPAMSPNVIGVGGTSLTLASDNTVISETGWTSGGGGVSAYESLPVYQSGVTLDSVKRTSPDVAYDADPNTGFDVDDSDYYGQGGMWQVGGTSAGAPQWAGLIAIADQGRALASMGSLSGASQTLPALYANSADFNDITSGISSNGRHNAATLDAGPGYDLVTGLGSPQAALLVQALAAWTTPAMPAGTAGGNAPNQGGLSRPAPVSSGDRSMELPVSAAPIGLGATPVRTIAAPGAPIASQTGGAAAAPRGLVPAWDEQLLTATPIDAHAPACSRAGEPVLSAGFPVADVHSVARPQAAAMPLGWNARASEAGLFATGMIAGNLADVLPNGSAFQDLAIRMTPAVGMSSDAHRFATHPLTFALGMAAIAGMYGYIAHSIEQARRKVVPDRFLVTAVV